MCQKLETHRQTLLMSTNDVCGSNPKISSNSSSGKYSIVAAESSDPHICWSIAILAQGCVQVQDTHAEELARSLPRATWPNSDIVVPNF